MVGMNLTRKLLTIPLLTIALLAPSACAGGEWFNVDDDSFEDRLTALNGAYKRGQKARQEIARVGIVLDNEVTCAEAWVTTGTRDEESRTRYTKDENGRQVVDKQFQELRRVSFINGCMNRPNDLTSVSPSTPAASSPASPAPSPAD